MRSKWITRGCCVLVSFPPTFGASYLLNGHVTAVSYHRAVVVSEALRAPAVTSPEIFSPTDSNHHQTSIQGAGSGNVAVEVPYTPPHDQIVAMCTSLASGEAVAPSRALTGLTEETGGTLRSTTDWCTHYLRRSSGVIRHG